MDATDCGEYLESNHYLIGPAAYFELVIIRGIILAGLT